MNAEKAVTCILPAPFTSHVLQEKLSAHLKDFLYYNLSLTPLRFSGPALSQTFLIFFTLVSHLVSIDLKCKVSFGHTIKISSSAFNYRSAPQFLNATWLR